MGIALVALCWFIVSGFIVTRNFYFDKEKIARRKLKTAGVFIIWPAYLLTTMIIGKERKLRKEIIRLESIARHYEQEKLKYTSHSAVIDYFIAVNRDKLTIVRQRLFGPSA